MNKNMLSVNGHLFRILATVTTVGATLTACVVDKRGVVDTQNDVLIGVINSADPHPTMLPTLIPNGSINP